MEEDSANPISPAMNLVLKQENVDKVEEILTGYLEENPEDTYESLSEYRRTADSVGKEIDEEFMNEFLEV